VELHHLWKTNRKSHIGFRLVPISVTLNDYNTLLYPINVAFSGARCAV